MPDLIARLRAIEDPLADEAANEVGRLRQALTVVERNASWTCRRPHGQGFEPTCCLCVARRALGIRNPIEENPTEAHRAT